MNMNYFDLSKNAQKTAIIQVREIYPDTKEFAGIILLAQLYNFDKRGYIVK